MGRYNLPSQISLSDSGPPPNANFHPAGKHQSLQGHGSPENRVLGYTGDEYLDIDTGDKWNKMGPTDEPRRATVDEWEVDGGSESGLVTSTGTTTARTVGDRWAELRNLRDFGDLDDGVATLTAAFAEWDHVVIDGTVSVASNMTIAAGKVLIFRAAGALKPASGVKITINGEVQAPRIQIFDYSASGKVVFTSVGIGIAPGTFEVFPEWYGAKADNTGTNNDAAFGRYYDQTLEPTENQHPLALGMGYYDFSTGFTGRNGMVIRGHPSGKTRLQFSPTAVAGTARFITMPNGVDNPIFENLNLIARAVTAGVRTIAIGHTDAAHQVTEPIFHKVTFTTWNQYALDFGGVTNPRMYDCKFISVSNLAVSGGTGVGSAICLNVQTFGNALLFHACRTSNCEQLLKSASSAGVSITGECAFEQGASAPLDAITGRGPFIEVLAGAGVHCTENYFEGIDTDTPDAIFSVTAVNGWSFSRNQVTLHRSGDSTSHADVVVSQNGASFGGEVAHNRFYGAPANFYIFNDGSGGPVLAPGNVYHNDSGTVQLTHSQISSKLSADIMVMMPTEWNFSRPQTTRMTTDSTGIVYPFTLIKRRSGGAGGINDGVGIKCQAMVDDGSIQNIGEQHWIYRNAAASVETADIVLKSLHAGAVVTPATYCGAGGITVRGDVQPSVRASAVDAAVTQADGTIYLTADAKTATLPNSGGPNPLPVGSKFTVALVVGGTATGTVAFTNAGDRIQPSNAATYSLSADGKYVCLQLVAANTWIIIANN